MATDYTNPSYLPGPFAFDDPAADFRRFASQQPQFFQRQRGLSDWNQRMQARYLLDAPYMSTGSGNDPSYFDYLTQSTSPSTPAPGTSFGFNPSTANYEALVMQAREAARAGTTAPGVYLDEANLGNQADFNRRAWLSSQFAGENAAANQMAVAKLLALQRNRGATEPAQAYSGQMGQAIRGAMNTLYQNRLNQGAPKESFLDWYLSASGQRGT